MQSRGGGGGSVLPSTEQWWYWHNLDTKEFMRIETKVWASAAPPPAQHRASGLKSPALSLGRETDEASNNPTFLEEAWEMASVLLVLMLWRDPA